MSHLQHASDHPRVSVLIIAYNHEAYIRQTIDSVLAQETDFEFEIVIGEDRSPDRTGDIVREYAARYPDKIRLIVSDTNVGGIRNTKRCFEAAKGEYIAMVEGDDYWLTTTRLQKQVEYLDTHPEVGLVHGDVHLYFEEEDRWVYNQNTTDSSDLVDDYSFESVLVCNKHFIRTMTACYRKSIIEQAGTFDLAEKHGWKLGDLAHWLAICKLSKCHYMPEAIAVYRLRSESASRSASDKKKLHEFHLSVFDIRYYFLNLYSKGNASLKQRVDWLFVKMMLADAYVLKNRAILKKALEVARESNYRLTLKNRILLLLAKFQPGWSD